MATTTKAKTVKKKVTVKKAVTKKAKAKAEPKKVFYVNITDPLVKQRVVLEVTADYLRMLQNIERVNAVRAKKKEMFKKFHKQMSVIRADVSSLYKVLPKYNLPHKVKTVEPKPIEPVVVKAAPKKVEPKTEIDSLEAELAAIEGRLTQI